MDGERAEHVKCVVYLQKYRLSCTGLGANRFLLHTFNTPSITIRGFEHSSARPKACSALLQASQQGWRPPTPCPAPHRARRRSSETSTSCRAIRGRFRPATALSTHALWQSAGRAFTLHRNGSWRRPRRSQQACWRWTKRTFHIGLDNSACLVRTSHH